jgi:hypothetical protein
MSTEEKDIKVEDHVDFETQDETNTDELTPEVSDFENSEESDPEVADISTETPSIETSSPEATGDVMDTPEPAAEITSHQEDISSETPQPQETSSPGRVMRFEDFVNNRD